MMLLIFGYALSLDVDRIPTMIYDLDHTPQSEDLIREFRGSRYFNIVGETNSYRPIEREIDARRALHRRGDSRRLFAQSGAWAKRRRCSCCWTAAIRIPRQRLWATPRA